MENRIEDSLLELENALGYRFADRAFLCEALTHRSYRNEAGDAAVKDNERLEFFGDAVLSLCVSRELLERFPDGDEGVLTKVRASLVDEKTLAACASAIGLGGFLRLGKGEARSGGREKPSLLANAYEALLAAICLDGGLMPVQQLVQSHFAPLFDNLSGHAAGRDAKTEFQELVQSVYGTTPSYRLTSASGPDHARTFSVGVFVGEEGMGDGQGGSKKQAEQAAAARGMSFLKARLATRKE